MPQSGLCIVLEEEEDWADAQASLDPCWSQTHYVGFVMTRLIYLWDKAACIIIFYILSSGKFHNIY
jgi:hypothetical protein